jgi:hypothetical protein
MNVENFPSLDNATYCSSISRSNEEQLFGTATQAETWLILEHPQVFGPSAVQDSNLPEAVKAHLTSAVKTLPGARVQLIKREDSPYPRMISFFVGVTTGVRPRFYEFQLSDYAELLELDLQKIPANLDGYTNYLRAQPLYLVCTNGKRDPCCAKLGISFYTSLSNKEPDATWQTSHVGGHRFAANLVCFPHGLFYGRLGEDDAQKILETYPRGELLTEKYRGRSCFPGAAQAAEYFLHVQTGIKAIDAYSLESLKTAGENRWEVLFLETFGYKKHQLVIAGHPSEFEILQSCRDLERSQVMQFNLETYQALGS